MGLPRRLRRVAAAGDHTLVPWRGRPAPDALRYAAVGSSIAIPVLVWLGRRIAAADAGGRP